MKVLVAGTAAFIGMKIVNAQLERGENSIDVDNVNTRA